MSDASSRAPTPFGNHVTIAGGAGRIDVLDLAVH